MRKLTVPDALLPPSSKRRGQGLVVRNV